MMTNLQILALSKAIAAKAVTEARKGLAVGCHNVDVTVNVKGSIKVGEDYLRAPTASIPLTSVLALVLHHSGITGPAAKAIIVKAMTEALADDKKAKEIFTSTLGDIDKWEAELVAPVIAKLPKVKVNGPVTTDLETTLVETVIVTPVNTVPAIS